MQRTRKPLQALLAISALFLIFAPGAMAAGTLSGTGVDNMATINFQVGGVAQTAIESSPTGNSTPGAGNGVATNFVVDNKVNLTVTRVDAAEIEVTPGQVGAVLEFTVTNNGNTTQSYTFTTNHWSTNNPFGAGTNDNFDADGAVAVYVDSAATTGGSDSYDSGTDTATVMDSLAPDATRTVYIVTTIPLVDGNTHTVVNGDVSAMDLIATTCDAGTTTPTTNDDASAWDSANVQVVFADVQGTATASDIAEDGKHSAASAYEVVTVALEVTKDSLVVNDPFVGNYVAGSVYPKAIPGATVEYTITIVNSSASVGATGLSITDSLDTEITGGRLAFDADGYAVGEGIQVNENGGADTNLTNASDGDNGDFGVTAGNTVTVTGLTVNASSTTTVKFRVVIQ